MPLDVLVIDDELDIRELISDILKDEGFHSRCAANSTQAFQEIEKKTPHAIILDIWLQGSELDGLGILEVVKKKYPLMPVVVISGHGTIETAVSAIKMGAYDYLEKPFSHEKLMIILKRACESAKLKRENIDLKSKVVDRTELVGNSSAIVRLKAEIDKVAPTASRIMINGEAGVGKELVARIIHKKSKRASGPFITFCPTGMSADKVLHELFGIASKNSGPARLTRRLSILEAANHGTLYIDQVVDLPSDAQNHLLKFLQDQTIEKPNDAKKRKLDVRIITSSLASLPEAVESSQFRQDLFYRLNVVPLKVCSISERKEDIPLLVEYFVKQLSKFSGLKERNFSQEAIAALQAYNWPGNIRQLRNVIEWSLIMNPVPSSDDTSIKAEMLPAEILNNGMVISKPDYNLDMMSMPLREAREVFERQYLSAQMNRFNNNISKTSAFVGMERSALHRKLKLLNIHSGSKNNTNLEEA